MKLKSLAIVETTDYNCPAVNGVFPTKLYGTIEFSGKIGSMKFELTKQDFTDIEQLLLKKTKDLAQEA